MLFMFEGATFFKVGHFIFPSDLNIVISSSDRLSGTNDVTSDKLNFIPDIRQSFFFKTMRTSKF